jgi:cyclic-di-AMP phosphodiesterase PgpH
MTTEQKIEQTKEFLQSTMFRQLVWLIVVSTLLTWLMSPVFRNFSLIGDFKVGDISKKTIIAPFDFTAIGEKSKENESKMILQVKKGEAIAREGDKLDAEHVLKINQLKELRDSSYAMRATIGYFICSLIFISLAFVFTSHLVPSFKPSNRDLFLISLIFTGSFILLRMFMSFESSSLIFCTPVAAGPILLQVTLGAPSVIFFLLSFGLLSMVFLHGSWLFLLIAVVGGAVGAISVRLSAKRSIFILSGVRVGVINFLILTLAYMIKPEHGFYEILCAFIGGAFSGLLALSFTPIAEYIGAYVTDIKLLELASLDRPLLRELSMQAPGTWNHSVVIGQISEAAAEAIHANALLVRVGAYYHDIGKTKKPGYFTENQSGKDNKHDKLTPSMSALIIKAHVKDGIEMAEKYRLPKAIIDFIPQHHGTSLIEFFYNKAVKEASDGETVDESHYRYSGPKPQTKESGILMLADCIEASSRTLTDPTPAKIQGLVQKQVNRIFASGQLDESDLTLRDLHLIAKEFTRVLSGIYHRRTEYDEPASKVSQQKVEKDKKEAEKKVEEKKTDQKKVAENSAKPEGASAKNASKDDSSEKSGENPKSASSEKEDKKTNGDTLKRLGM